MIRWVILGLIGALVFRKAPARSAERQAALAVSATDPTFAIRTRGSVKGLSPLAAVSTDEPNRLLLRKGGTVARAYMYGQGIRKGRQPLFGRDLSGKFSTVPRYRTPGRLASLLFGEKVVAGGVNSLKRWSGALEKSVRNRVRSAMKPPRFAQARRLEPLTQLKQPMLTPYGWKGTMPFWTLRKRPRA